MGRHSLLCEITLNGIRPHVITCHPFTQDRHPQNSDLEFKPMCLSLCMQGMGFSKTKAKEALEECHYRVDMAVEWLVNHCM